MAAATVFIASKLVEPCPISGTDLIRYTDDTYQLTELLVSNAGVGEGAGTGEGAGAGAFNTFLC